MMSPKARLEDVFNQGVDARAQGRQPGDNPYCAGTPERDEWTAGWEATPDLDEEDDPESSRLRASDD